MEVSLISQPHARFTSTMIPRDGMCLSFTMWTPGTQKSLQTSLLDSPEDSGGRPVFWVTSEAGLPQTPVLICLEQSVFFLPMATQAGSLHTEGCLVTPAEQFCKTQCVSLPRIVPAGHTSPFSPLTCTKPSGRQGGAPPQSSRRSRSMG